MTEAHHATENGLGPPPCDHDAYTPCPPACKDAKDKWRRDAARELSAMQQAPVSSNLESIERLARESGDWRAAFDEVRMENERLRERVKDLQQFHDWAEPQITQHGKDMVKIDRLTEQLALVPKSRRELVKMAQSMKQQRDHLARQRKSFETTSEPPQDHCDPNEEDAVI